MHIKGIIGTKVPGSTSLEQKCQQRLQYLCHPPMVVDVSRTPVGRAQDGVERADDVHEGVAHQEEEVDHSRDVVHGAHQDAQLGDQRGDDQAVEGLESGEGIVGSMKCGRSGSGDLILLGHLGEWPQEGDHVVLGNAEEMAHFMINEKCQRKAKNGKMPSSEMPKNGPKCHSRKMSKNGQNAVP
jgi:hypothetical protein